MKHNTTPAGIFLCASNILGAVFATFPTLAVFALVTQLFVSCGNGFFHDALYTKTLTISATGKTGTLLWIDDGGDVRRKAFSSQETENEIDTVSITVSKGYVTPVLFFDESEEHPEGFVYPFYSTFTEAGGFAAHILYRLIKDSDDSYGDKHKVRLYTNHFNWKKFQTLVEQAFEKGENPWGFDQTLILESIADGSFTPHVLKP